MSETWIPKEIAEDYGFEYDAIRLDNYYVHLSDPNYQKKMNKHLYYYMTLKEKIEYNIRQIFQSNKWN